MVRRYTWITYLTLLSGVLTFFFFFLGIGKVGASSHTNPFANTSFYVDTDSQAYQAYRQTLTTNPSEAATIEKIARVPQAVWFGGWNGDIRRDVDAYVSKAAATGSIPVLVAYNIPLRDCNGYSSGGAATASEYRNWIDAFLQGIASRKAVVIFEPDGLGLIDCASPEAQATRLELYRYSLDRLTQNPNVSVYIDASMWVPAEKMASLLSQAGIVKARGIVVNVSGYQTTEESTSYIHRVKAAVGHDLHGVIDTSRNGLGPHPSAEWCNPPERAVGIPSTANTADATIDAYFWIKRPGESDGTCNGGPSAGTWWQSYAVGLVTRSPYFSQAPAPSIPTPTPTPSTTPSPTPTPTPVLQSSTLTVHAAGTPAQGVFPTVDVVIDGTVVQMLSHIRGDPEGRGFIAFTYTHPEPLSPDQVRLQFTNDLSVGSEDRNVRIDKIVIDGVSYETEDAATYSTGTWNSTTDCAPGNKQSEWLHCAGYVQYAGGSVGAPTPTPTPTVTPTPAPTPTPVVTPTPSPTVANNAFRAEYFGNRTLSGSPIVVRGEAEINHEWAGGSPDPQIGADNFSVRWTKTFTTAQGTYTFSTTADDGIRVFLDGTVVIDNWRDQPPTTHTVQVPLSEGSHTVVVEYYENGGGAMAKFLMGTAPQPVEGAFFGEYFNNRHFEGTPSITRNDATIEFDWSGGSPVSSLSHDSFSVRWTRTVTLPAGTYQFTVSGDDGYRLSINNTRIIDSWRDQPRTTSTVTHTLPQGSHTIVLEYYENSGNASVSFGYTQQ